MATLVEMLRQKNEAKAAELKAKQASENWAQFNATPQEAVVSSGPSQTTRIGDSHIIIPEQRSINYGGILSNAIGNFMGVRSKRQAADAAAKNEALSQQFMGEMLSSNPEALKVYQLQQLGVPGMEKKLADLIAPEKEKLVNLVQHAKDISPNLTDEQYEELGKPYGVSGSMVKSYAIGAQQQEIDTFERKQKGERELIDYRARRDESIAARNRASAERVAKIKAQGKGGEGGISMTEDGKPDYTRTMNYGDWQFRNKTLSKVEENLTDVNTQLNKFDSVIAGIEKMSNAEWIEQRGAKSASEAGALGKLMGIPYKNDVMMQLEGLTNEVALGRLQRMSGPDSDKDFERVNADQPTAYNDKEVALAAVRRMKETYENTARALELESDYYKRGAFKSADEKRDFYKRAKAEVAEQRRQAATAPTTPTIPGVTAPQAAPAPGGFTAPQGYSIRVR